MMETIVGNEEADQQREYSLASFRTYDVRLHGLKRLLTCGLRAYMPTSLQSGSLVSNSLASYQTNLLGCIGLCDFGPVIYVFRA